MGEWFIDWFNTPEYLTVYKHRNDQDALYLVELITRNVNLPAGSLVLDMACGAGRHSILFAKKGFKVTAFDYSEMLLSEARKRAESENLKIDFYREDIRNFNFDIKFDLVVNLFTSFGYFDDDSENQQVIAEAYKHVKDNGYFVLDFFNSEYVKKNLVAKSDDIISGSRVIQERFLDKERIKKRITVYKNSHSELYYEDVRLYSHKELKAKLTEQGFTIRNVYGDFKGSEFDSESSPRVIIIASR